MKQKTYLMQNQTAKGEKTMTAIELKKRTQAERVAIASTLLESVWDEVRTGNADDILQEMVYVQMFTNRIVWKLNEINGGSPK